MTKRNGITLLICLGIFWASYLVRSYVLASMRAAYYQQQQAMRQAQQRRKQETKPKATPPPKASAQTTTPPGPKAATRGPSPTRARSKPAPSPLAKIAGIWRGRAAIDGRGICDLRLELKDQEDGHFSGFSTMTCIASGPLAKRKGIDLKALAINRVDPEAAILSGRMVNGSVELRTDKVVGADSNGCAPSSFSLTPFGSGELAAEWQETGCDGGHVLMQKARR